MRAKYISQRFMRCAAVIAAGGAIVVASNVASAAAKLEITLNGHAPGGGAGSAGKTLVLTPANVGTPIPLSVWATITGADNTSTANDGLQILEANFRSFGPILGNMAHQALQPIWAANASSGGTQFGTPGDFDLGSLNPSIAADWWIAISKEPQSVTGPTSNGIGSLLLGTITFTPTQLSLLGVTTLQADYRHALQGALWFEDATIIVQPDPIPDIWSNDRNVSTGTITVGEPITITATPEPASLGLIAVAAPLLLCRRRVAR
jgi:hypothetical protein